jgi:apolipoprotein N-acyltransferase
LGALLVCLLGGIWQTRQSVARWKHQQQTQVFSVIQPSVQKGLTPQALVKDMTGEEILHRQQVTINLSYASVAQYLPFSSGRPNDRPLVVWPESAISYPPYVPQIMSFCQNTQSYLLAGAVYFAPPNSSPRNSAYLIGPGGMDIGRFDKIHLVPFGEFVPLRSLVTRFYTVRDDDLTRGTGWRPLQMGSHRLGVGICFESTFPSIFREYAKDGAHYLVIITNDAWFHKTSAVRQHFNHSRFRALETGLPVIRSASTGISGFIAPDGRVLAEIPIYQSGFRTMHLSEGIPGTVYSTAGWLFAPCCLLISIILFFRGLYILPRRSSANQTSTSRRSRTDG